MPRITPGTQMSPLSLPTIQGVQVEVPSKKGRILHLQFRRFAGCPICNLHLRSVAKRHAEIASAGVEEVAFFHSNAETMRPYQGDLPFAVVADPDKRYYRLFGVEEGLIAIADPRAWIGFLRGATASHPSSGTTGEGGHLGLPADFLIEPTGRVLDAKYGKHADDQWSVDEILARARGTAHQ